MKLKNTLKEMNTVTGTVVIVTYNSESELNSCFSALIPQIEDAGMHLIVVDNASTDGSLDWIKKWYPEVELIENTTNKGFAKACNQAYSRSKGDFFALLNPDAILSEKALVSALDYMKKHSEVGIVGGKLLNSIGEIEPSARLFPCVLHKFLNLSGLSSRFPESHFFSRADYGWFDHEDNKAVDWVPGAFSLMRSQMLRELGCFDERFFLYYEETDLCKRARSGGWEIHYVADCEIHHSGGASSAKVANKSFDTAGSQVRSFRLRSECLYHRKHGGVFSVMANLGLEASLHILRYVKTSPLLLGDQMKHKHAKSVLLEIFKALRDTRIGRVSPSTPW